MRGLLLISAAAALAACQTEAPADRQLANADGAVADLRANPTDLPDQPVSSDDPQPVGPPEPDLPTSDCPIVRSSGWRAHVDAMPGPNDNPRLIVSGKVTVPTGGYRLALAMGAVAESYPVQITINLNAVPPASPATQALETHEVRGSWRSEERVGSVTVRCGSRVLARLANIATAR